MPHFNTVKTRHLCGHTFTPCYSRGWIQFWLNHMFLVSLLNLSGHFFLFFTSENINIIWNQTNVSPFFSNLEYFFLHRSYAVVWVCFTVSSYKRTQCNLQDPSPLSRLRLEQMYLFPRSTSILNLLTSYGSFKSWKLFLYYYFLIIILNNNNNIFFKFDMSEETNSMNLVFPGDST